MFVTGMRPCVFLSEALTLNKPVQISFYPTLYQTASFYHIPTIEVEGNCTIVEL